VAAILNTREQFMIFLFSPTCHHTVGFSLFFLRFNVLKL